MPTQIDTRRRFSRAGCVLAGAIWLVCSSVPALRAQTQPLLLEPANEQSIQAQFAAQSASATPTFTSSTNDSSEIRLAQSTPGAAMPPITPVAPTTPAPPPIDVLPAPVPEADAPGGPLLDGNEPIEHVLPPVVDGGSEFHRVRPYGGGHPTDWSWGCGGSPYRTYGTCDDWKVGCRWRVNVDGMVMTRDEVNLDALDARLRANDPEGTVVGAPPVALTPTYDQFDRGVGGRVVFMSQVARHVGWDVMAAYEGIPEWNASIVFPKLPLTPPALPPPGGPDPPDPADLATEQRRFHYTSTLHSAELNFLRHTGTWRPFCGVRYIKFDDEINDFYDQEAPPPLPEQLPIPPNDLTFVTVTDRLNLYDIQNNLMGFQIGLLHDSWRVNRRLSLEGFVSGGVYYNRVKYTNLMGTFTTQFINDNIESEDFDESRIDFSDTTNNDVREYSEIAYVAEASLSGVLRLNKCWALRGGYQMLWINNVHLAEDAFLGVENLGNDLFFHGWHAGIECRR